ncbi:hypothetical protein ACFL2G_04130 [Candidatus Omnitrophota bacterium]
MNKKIISLLIIVYFVLGAVVCFGEKNSPEFEFVRDYVESLRFLKLSVERHRESNLKSVNYQTEIEMVADFMKDFRLDNHDLGVAKSILDKYVRSENKVIKEIVPSILIVYDMLIGVNAKTLELYERLYSPELVNNPGKINKSLCISSASKIMADRERAEKQLLEANVLVTITLVNSAPGKKGFFAINSKERKELISLIDEIFSYETYNEAGLTYVDSCGAAMRRMLASD